MKIAVMGAGAMGSIYGGRLAESGEDVWLIDIVPEIVSTVNKAGLRLEGNGGDRLIPVRATTDPGKVGQADLVIMLVKTFDTEQAARDALPLIGPDTVILTVQNGLGNVEKIERIVGEDRVLAGAAYQAATSFGPGHVNHTVNKRTVFGELDGRRTGRVEAIAGALERAGLGPKITEDPTSVIWGKLLANVGINALCSITLLQSQTSIRIPEGEHLVRHLVTEAIEVGKAKGVKFPYEDPLGFVIDYMREPRPFGKPSMRQDIEAKRKTEIDSINGAIAAEGAALGVPTPYNSAFTCLVKLLEIKNNGVE